MGASAAPREVVCETLEDDGAPGISRLVLPETSMPTHGGHGRAIPCHPTLVRGPS
jgi:hypothetical protein